VQHVFAADNICRNLEWMTCAAYGWLPGQGNANIRFAHNPWWLFPDGRSGKPIDTCCGWVPHLDLPSSGAYGYATDDIFYLEVCLFNEICENGKDLFTLGREEEFTCQFSEWRFNGLRDLLLSGFEEPTDSRKCTNSHICPEMEVKQ
jgi:hypothetical protein